MNGALASQPQIGHRVKVMEPFRPVRFGRIIGVDHEQMAVFSIFQVQMEPRDSGYLDPDMDDMPCGQTVAWVAARHCSMLD